MALATGLLAATAAQASSTHPITERQRLSTWLATHGVVLRPGALHWWSRARQEAHVAEQAALVQVLGPSWSPLASMVRRMPVTGRVPLPSLDARLLEARPELDPWLQPGDRLQAWPATDVVSVLLPSGHVCRVPHDAQARLPAYVQACGVQGAARAWVAQADGQVQVMGLAADQRADLARTVSPGAWVWAPAAGDAPPPEVSARLVAFLATQPPSATDEPWALPRALSADVVAAPPPRAMPPLSNDWGGIGLLQMPSARMEPVGTAALTVTSALPYTELKARLQPFSWLSVDFGYLSISGRRYGPQEVAGDQSYKDKTADVKLRLWSEGQGAAWAPEVAVGWRDILGTGLFASEYIVATKAWGDMDLTAGLAFGYLGSRGEWRNPLGVVSERFKRRQRPDVGLGGTLDWRTFFTGPVSPFLGIQWAMPMDNWWLKAELDPIDYASELTGGRSVEQSARVNVALVHRVWPWLDLSLGLERGQRVALSVSAHAALPELNTPKRLDPPMPAVVDRAPMQAVPLAEMAKAIEVQTGGRVSLVQRRGERLSLRLHDPVGHAPSGWMDRVTAVVHASQPAAVREVVVDVHRQGLPVVSATQARQPWVQARTEWQPLPADDAPPLAVQRRPVAAAPAASVAQADPATATATTTWQAPESSAWKQGVGLHYRQNLGGPDGFWLYQLGVDWSAEWRLAQSTWVSGTARVRVLDNYDNFKFNGSSQLPRVRTLIREYLTTRRLTVPQLQITHAQALGDDLFAMGYAGLLETMYAGVGGELLYRPVDSRLALGVDVNAVQQRAFTQGLSLRDYRVNTGHLTAYWDTGWQDLLVKLSAGRYLAGDVGATLDMSRVFDNGVSLGAYATKTNVSAEQFGEGSFDKGIYVTIPFDVMLPRSSSSTAALVYAPLIRDGGARLSRQYGLYDLTRARDARLWVQPADGAP